MSEPQPNSSQQTVDQQPNSSQHAVDQQVADERVSDESGSWRWFSVLWPAAVLLHLAANPAHLMALRAVQDGHVHTPGLAQLALAGAAVAVMTRPSPRRALALAGSYLLVLWLKLPVVGNHEVILGLLAAAIGVAAMRALRQGDKTPVGWAAGAAPTCRWVLVISYSFIALSKLNADFFEPASSCATVFLREFTQLFGLVPGAPGRLTMAAIVVVAVTELAIAVLLVSGRFRVHGAVLGLVFHFVLALDPVGHVWDFSATLLPLFLLFMPAPFLARIDQRYRSIGRRLRSLGPAVIYLAIAVAAAAHGAIVVGPWADWTIAYPIWLLLSGPIVAAALLEPRRSRSGDQSSGADAVRFDRPVAIVLVIALLIGIGPYLEVRSAASFNMYSNLQVVDGQSNHYLIGSFRSQESNTASEIVAADLDSPLSYYVGTGLAVPNENLGRYLTEHPAEDVTLAPTSVLAAHSGSGPADESGSGLSGAMASIADTLRYKLAFRRAVDTSGAVECQRTWGPLG